MKNDYIRYLAERKALTDKRLVKTLIIALVLMAYVLIFLKIVFFN